MINFGSTMLSIYCFKNNRLLNMFKTYSILLIAVSVGLTGVAFAQGAPGKGNDA